MDSFIIYQLSCFIIFIFFILISVMAIRIFLPFKNAFADITLCFVIFCFLLAFNINFW